MPPLLPQIHRELRLDETSVGIVTALPVLLFAAAAIPGSLLISRLGARRAVIAGLSVVAVAGALRGLGPSFGALLVFGVVMGLGVAVIQPAFPTLVRDWFPGRVGPATAVYTNGILIGEIGPASLTIPLVLPLAGGSWEVALALWSLPVVVAVVLFLSVARQVSEPAPEGPIEWWPDWTDVNLWKLGAMLGCASVAYWGGNAFLPDFLRATGRPALVGPALAALNIGQFPASLIVAGFASQLLLRRRGFVVSGLAMFAGFLGIILLPGSLPVLAAAVTGLFSALAFVLGLALPPLLARPNDAHRLAAAMFTIAYTFSFAGPTLGGVVWDATGVPALGFLPGMLGGLAMPLLAWALLLPRTAPDHLSLETPGLP